MAAARLHIEMMPKAEKKPPLTSIAARCERADKRLSIAKLELGRAITEFKAARVALLAELHACPENVSPRELQVLEAVREGKQNKEIASDLHIAPRTVKFHVSNLLKKFKAFTRREL
jgi:DNA-binding NarL/FixJ family response regulator